LIGSLANYDRTYETILWSKRDWDLCLGIFRIQVTLKSLLSNQDAGTGLIHSQEVLQQLKENELVLYTLLHNNDRQVINLGFNYLDINISGKFKPFSTMPNRLIQIIEKKASNNHEVTIQQIQAIIAKDNQEIEVDLTTKDLFIVHSFFVQAFLEFVFSELDRVPGSHLAVDPVLARLKELESSKSRDPLHIHQRQQSKNEFNAKDYHGLYEKDFKQLIA